MKAFNTASRNGLYKVLGRLAAPWSFSNWCIHFMIACQLGSLSMTTSPMYLSLKCGVKQGCAMVPTLFGIYILVLICPSFSSPDDIALHTWGEQKLFNLCHLKAKARTNSFYPWVQFSDDVAFCAQTESKLQEMCDKYSASCNLFGLQISVQKTVLLVINALPSYIQINSETVIQLTNSATLTQW